MWESGNQKGKASKFCHRETGWWNWCFAWSGAPGQEWLMVSVPYWKHPLGSKFFEQYHHVPSITHHLRHLPLPFASLLDQTKLVYTPSLPLLYFFSPFEHFPVAASWPLPVVLMHGACVLGDRLGAALCLTSPGKAGWLAVPTPTAKGSVPYIAGIKQAGGMEAAFRSAVTWTKTRSSGTLLTANLTTPPSVMLLLRRHIRVLRWMRELGEHWAGAGKRDSCGCLGQYKDCGWKTEHLH